MKTREADPVMRHIGARLRALRDSRGWSLTKAARIAQIPDVVLASYERAQRNPVPEKLFRLAEAYGVQVGSLFPPQEDRGPDLFEALDRLRVLVAVSGHGKPEPLVEVSEA